MAENENNNLQVPEEPEFTKEIPGIDPEDPVHFAQMNGILEKLLGNDVFLDKLANKMIEKNLIAHVLDCENAQMVLGADQAPVITGLIDEVKEDVTQLYSEIVYFHSVPPIPSVDILEMALNCINGLTLVRTSEHTINIPGDGRYSMGLILKYETIITIILTSWSGTGIHINTHAGNPASWTGWRTI